MWARRFECCVKCCSAAFKHYGKGLCASCYAKAYKLNPARKRRIAKLKRAWYWRYHDENMRKCRCYREQKHYAGKRDEILERDGHMCTNCSATELLVVHHKNGKGRSCTDPDNSLDNLVTLCRKCHIAEHRNKLQNAKHRNHYVAKTFNQTTQV